MVIVAVSILAASTKVKPISAGCKVRTGTCVGSAIDEFDVVFDVEPLVNIKTPIMIKIKAITATPAAIKTLLSLRYFSTKISINKTLFAINSSEVISQIEAKDKHLMQLLRMGGLF